MLFALSGGEWIGIATSNVEADENPLDAGQVPNDFADGRRQLAYECGDGQNLVTLRKLRIFHQIDDLDTIATGQSALHRVARGCERPRLI